MSTEQSERYCVKFELDGVECSTTQLQTQRSAESTRDRISENGGADAELWDFIATVFPSEND